MNKIQYKLMEHQLKLVHSSSKQVCMFCGRQVGKSYVASLLAALKLIQGKRVVLFAQTFKALKNNLCREIRKRLQEMKVRYKFDKSDLTFEYGEGNIYCFSYENIEPARGTTAVDLIIADEIALAPANLFETVNALLLFTNGTSVMLTTPRAGSWFNRYITEHPDIEIIRATTYDNKLLPPEAIERYKNSIADERFIQQEIYGQIVADDSLGYMFQADDFSDSTIYESPMYKIGIDPAGYGRDCTSLTLRKGGHILEHKKWKTIDSMQLETEVVTLINKYGVDFLQGIFIDLAYGTAIYERLHKRFPCELVSFSGAAESEEYANIRAEMYFRCMNAVKQKKVIVRDEDMKEELMATRYKLNNRDRIILVDKAIIKASIGRSPDAADSLILTYATEDAHVVRQPRSRESTASYAAAMMSGY